MVNIINFINNNLMLSVVFVLLVIVYLSFEFFSFVSQGKSSAKVSPNKLIDLFNHKKAVVIDIRPDNQYINGHIVGAINVPFNVCNKDHKFIKSNANNTLIIVDNYGKEAALCCDALRKTGIEDIFYLGGGLNGWCLENMPLVKAPPKLNLISNNNSNNSNNNNIIIYTKNHCPYCVSAKNLLRNKGHDYTEIYITDMNSKEFKEMVSLSGGVKTFPQIFINSKHIGGFDSLQALNDKGELDQILTAGKSV